MNWTANSEREDECPQHTALGLREDVSNLLHLSRPLSLDFHSHVGQGICPTCLLWRNTFLLSEGFVSWWGGGSGKEPWKIIQ